MNSSDSALFQSQKMTIESLKSAKRYSSNQVEVVHVAVFDKGEKLVSEFGDIVKVLERSVLDVYPFSTKKKLPLINDLLVKALEVTKPGDYLIYTNIDIVVLPFFYDYILQFIREKGDALIINRRTIELYKGKSLVELYSEIGKTHPGFDCFVFPAVSAEKFIVENVCLGASWAGKAFYINMVATCKALSIIRDSHITFHLGDDQKWRNNDFYEYKKYNGDRIVSTIDKIIMDNSLKLKDKKLLINLKKDIIKELHYSNKLSLFERFFR